MPANYPLPPSYQKQPAHPLDYSNLSVGEAYKHYNKLARQLSPEQLQAFKINLIKPYRTKNALLGGGLLASALVLLRLADREKGGMDRIMHDVSPPASPACSIPAPEPITNGARSSPVGYSAYKTRRGDDFDAIPMPPPPSSAPIEPVPAPAK
ncbi:hypothetical protein HK097_008069 [Rhizophlyctis rosea]|uniref:Uncharacterized protein n=1 Tax=Rhizophlyctis rosea TaxID=64517 RepID=A0AAD5SCB9_9FUNG|nr:hypothetical protein HK097_008069 [Rhizophlyctis rosea]